MSERLLRIVGLTELHVRVGSRTAVLPGERLLPPDHAEGFWADRDDHWRWSDGLLLDTDEQAAVREVIRTAGPLENVSVELEPLGAVYVAPAPPPDWVRAAIFEFRGRHLLVFSSHGGQSQIPGTLGFGQGRPHFAASGDQPWLDASGRPLTPEERAELWGRLKEAASFKSIDMLGGPGGLA